MKQGEIWLINLDPTVGAEIKKTRPAVIVNDNSVGKLPLKIIVPLTEWKDRYHIAPWMIKIMPDKNTQINKPSAADCFQVRSISEQRFIKRIGIIDMHSIEQIKNGLSKVLSIGF
jgi:mRNA interferase MazF